MTSATTSLGAISALSLADAQAQEADITALQTQAEGVLGDLTAVRDIIVKLNYVRDGVTALQKIQNNTAALGQVLVAKAPSSLQDDVQGGVDSVVAAIGDTITTLTGNLTLWQPCDEDEIGLCEYD